MLVDVILLVNCRVVKVIVFEMKYGKWFYWWESCGRCFLPRWGHSTGSTSQGYCL